MKENWAQSWEVKEVLCVIYEACPLRSGHTGAFSCTVTITTAIKKNAFNGFLTV